MTPLDKKLANAKRQRARERAQAPDAAAIVAGIDLATVAGHNLRALLLRVADSDDWQGGCFKAPTLARLAAREAGLVEPTSPSLTPLGRAVAERLRPEPWCVRAGDDRGRNVFDVERGNREPWAQLENEGMATRIAALLTADDLAQAKAYRSEPG
jgi:hypothetical protein